MKTAQDERASRKLIGGLRVFFIAALPVLVSACTSVALKPEAANREKLAELFAETYREVESVHIEQTDVAELALSGLRSLAAADEELTDQYLIGPGSGAAVPGARDYDAWGAATSEAVIGLVARSERLQAMKPQQVYDLFATGLADRLAEPSEFFPGKSVSTVLWARLTRKFDMGYDLVADGAQITRLDPKGELEEQGLKLGDVIVDIEGTPTAGLPKVRIFELLGSGLVFGSTTLTVHREGVPAPITLDLWETTGGHINIQYRENDGVAEYDFTNVDYNATRVIELGISRRVGLPFPGLSAATENMADSILLDLRNTPDRPDLPVFAEMDSIVRLADTFLGARRVVAARSRHVGRNEEWRSSRHFKGKGYPLVIIVDGMTSGAAEIAAAALQDAGRALVVGSSTAGNGKLHTLVALPIGGAIVMPSALAYSSGGYPIEGRGVMPNICTSLPGGTLDSVLAALRQGDGLIPVQARRKIVPPDDTAAIRELRALCPPRPDAGDLAYEVSFAILKDPELYARLLKQSRGY